MNNKLRMALVVASMILLSSSTALFADVATANATKSYSAKSSVSHRNLQQETAITNEAEYAEFVRKNERASQTSSVKSTPTQTSRYLTTSASSSRTKIK